MLSSQPTDSLCQYTSALSGHYIARIHARAKFSVYSMSLLCCLLPVVLLLPSSSFLAISPDSHGGGGLSCTFEQYAHRQPPPAAGIKSVSPRYCGSECVGGKMTDGRHQQNKALRLCAHALCVPVCVCRYVCAGIISLLTRVQAQRAQTRPQAGRVREREHGKAEGTRALSETDLGEDSFVSSHLLHFFRAHDVAECVESVLVC
jgi:hypothetical protein